MTSLCLYLMDGSALSKSEIEKYSLKLENKKSAQQLGTAIMKRIYEEEEETSVDDDDDETTNNCSTSSTLTFKEILQQQVDNKWGQGKNTENVTKELGSLSRDFKFFEQHNKRSPLLEKLFLSLCSIQPTSTQNERNFSLSGNFVSKLRTSLSPHSPARRYVEFLENFLHVRKK